MKSTNVLRKGLIFLVFFLKGCVSLGIMKDRIISPEQVGEEVIFRLYAPSATVVSVAGEFNGWEHKPDQPRTIRLKRKGDTWEAKIKIPPGRYEYKFVLDYQTWILDPYNPYTVDDGRGNINSLLIVR